MVYNCTLAHMPAVRDEWIADLLEAVFPAMFSAVLNTAVKPSRGRVALFESIL